MRTAETNDPAARPLNPFGEYCGIRITCVRPGYCRAEAAIEEHDLNGRGFAHGGFLFTMLDSVACGAARAVDGGRVRPLVTQNAAIYYLRPIRAGKLRAEAHTVKSGRSVALVTVDIYDEADNHIVRGELTAFYTGEPCDASAAETAIPQE